jgi:hypothetical protein
MGCMAIKPQVKRMQKDLGEAAIVLRVSIHSEVGRTLTKRYNFEASPLFILFDPTGEEVWRGSQLPSKEYVLGIERE